MTQTAQGKCPICGKPAAANVRPFCSPRCATLDLGHWLGEGYRIPDAEPSDEELPFLPNPGEGEE